MSKKSMVFQALGWIMVVLACFVLPAMMIAQEMKFEVACSRYIERATRTNNVEKAIDNLDIALEFIEENGYTKGNTSIFIEDPDNDIQYWYENVLGTRNELEQVVASSAEEQSNVLMKAKETLTYADDNGSARIPFGIEFYPNLLYWFIAEILFVVLCALFFWLWDIFYFEY